jgi:hypothetical protein
MVNTPLHLIKHRTIMKCGRLKLHVLIIPALSAQLYAVAMYCNDIDSKLILGGFVHWL